VANKKKEETLTAEQIARIRLLYRRGFSLTTLALIYKVTRQRIYQLCKDDGKGEILQLLFDLLPNPPPELPLPRCALTPDEQQALTEALNLWQKLRNPPKIHEFVKGVNERGKTT
jgi:hypothetical protein